MSEDTSAETVEICVAKLKGHQQNSIDRGILSSARHAKDSIILIQTLLAERDALKDQGQKAALKYLADTGQLMDKVTEAHNAALDLAAVECWAIKREYAGKGDGVSMTAALACRDAVLALKSKETK